MKLAINTSAFAALAATAMLAAGPALADMPDPRDLPADLASQQVQQVQQVRQVTAGTKARAPRHGSAERRHFTHPLWYIDVQKVRNLGIAL